MIQFSPIIQILDNVKKAVREIDKEIGVRVYRASSYLHSALRQTVSKPGRRDFGGKHGSTSFAGGRRIRRIAGSLKKRAEAKYGKGYGRIKLRRGEQSGRILGLTYASKPGEPPHRQTGFLWRSIRQKVERTKHQALVGLVGAEATVVKYGKALEYGTKSHVISVKTKKVLANPATGQFFGKRVKVKMAPRPWFKPTIERERDKITRILKGEG